MIDRYINPLTDFSFKRLFGSEINKELLISFLNAIFHGEQIIQDVTSIDSEPTAIRTVASCALFEVCCKNDKGGKWIDVSIYHNAVFSFSSQLIYIFFVNILTMIAVLFC
jgi:hypothetical protein